MERQTLLRTVPIFASLSDEHLGMLSTRLSTRRFARGETIFLQGTVGNELYIILDGQVRIYTVTESGQEFSVMIFCSHDFFGELALLDGQLRSASAVAMRQTETVMLHRDAFQRGIIESPQIAVSVMEALSYRLRHANTYLEHLAVHSAPQRVVRRLLDLADQHGVADGEMTRIDLHLTQDDLASLAGTTRETVNRVLAGLRDQGLIRVERARVSVLNLGLLEQLG